MKPMKPMKALFSLLLILFICNLAYTADDFRFRKLPVNLSFPNKHVITIEQDSLGYIWLGSYSNVVRYDGYEIKVYKHSPNDSSSIGTRSIEDIHSDEEGNLWFCGSGLSLYNRKTDDFSVFSDTLVDDVYIKSISSTPGFIWAGTSNGLHVFDKRSKAFSKTNIYDHITNLDIKGSKIYFTTPKSYLKCYDIEKKELEIIFDPTLNSKYGDELMVQHVLDNGTVWFSGNGKLFRYKNSELKCYLIPLPECEFDYSIHSVFVIDESNIYIGTINQGLLHFNSRTESITQLRTKTNSDYSITANTIPCIFQDKDKTLWIGTHNGGVNILSTKDLEFNHQNKETSNYNSIPFNLTSCFLETKNKKMLICTDGGGISLFDNNTFANNILQLNTKAVTDIDKDRDGNIFVSQWQGGVSVFNDKLNLVHQNLVTKDIASSNDIKGILIDSKQRLWIFSPFMSTIIYDLKTQTYHNKQTPGSFPPELFNYKNRRDAIEDKKGNIWLYGTNELIKYDIKNKVTVYDKTGRNDSVMSSYFIYHMFVSNENNIWIASANGLELFSPSTNSFINISEKYNFPETIFAINQDKKNYIWLSSLNGL